MKFDPYRILGISPGADIEEIRRAFREKARRFHPDLGGQKELFLALKRSYEILQARHAPARLEIFKGRPQGDHYVLSFLDVTAREVAVGAAVTVVIPDKPVPCPHCGGSGQNPAGPKRKCLFCEGEGMIEFSGPERRLRIVCPRCGGKGEILVDICPKCRGKGELSGEKELELSLPLGPRPGDILYLPPGAGGEVAVFFELQVHPSGCINFEGERLVSRALIPFWRFALREKISIETLEGPEDLDLPADFQPGQTLVLPRRGPWRADGSREDLYVKIDVFFPSDFSPKARNKLKELAEFLEKEEKDAPSGRDRN